VEHAQPGAVPGPAEALLAEGHALVADGDVEQGLACFRRAAAAGSVLGWFDLATCLLDLGRWAQAHAAFASAAHAAATVMVRRATEDDAPVPAAVAPAPAPAPAPAAAPAPRAAAPSAEVRLRAEAEHDPAARAALGRLLHASGRVDEARRVLERGTALEERDSWLPLGNLLLDAFDDPVAAVTAYRGGIAAGDVMCHSALGLLLRDLGDARGAAEEFRLGAGAVRPETVASPAPVRAPAPLPA
jgi:tetratricopeptide (TPR) repeat protein